MTNKYGLKRSDITAPQKRQIRQAAGFGCVICGLGLYEYEHVDPEFADAEEHDPTKMTLLCGQHHIKKSKGMLSKETVLSAMAAPFCRRVKNAHENFDFGTQMPQLRFAGSTLANCRIPISVNGVALFEIKPPEEPGTPFLLSGNFYDSASMNSLTIVDNEWQASSDNWDVETVGNTITIREKAGKIHLKLTAHPPHGIVIDRIDMMYDGIRIEGDANKLIVNRPGGRRAEVSGCLSSGFPVGMAIGAPPPGLHAGFSV